MSSAVRTLLTLISVTALLTPFVGFAAVTTGVDAGGKEKGNTLDACKTGSADAAKGKVTGGDVHYDNIVEIKKGRVYIKCARAPEDRDGMVSFCNMVGKCALLYKDSKEGKNILELYDVAQSVSVPYGDGFYRADPRDVLANMLNDSQMKEIDSMIGKQTFPRYGEAADYGTVLGLAATYSAPEDLSMYPPKNSYREAIDQALEAMAQPASVPRAPDITSGLPIAIDPSIQRDWSKPNRVDFLSPWQNAEVMNELYWRQRNEYNANQRVQNTFEDLLLPPPAPPVLASSPSENANSSSWFTRSYNWFYKFIFGR